MEIDPNDSRLLDPDYFPTGRWMIYFPVRGTAFEADSLEEVIHDIAPAYVPELGSERKREILYGLAQALATEFAFSEDQRRLRQSGPHLRVIPDLDPDVPPEEDEYTVILDTTSAQALLISLQRAGIIDSRDFSSPFRGESR